LFLYHFRLLQISQNESTEYEVIGRRLLKIVGGSEAEFGVQAKPLSFGPVSGNLHQDRDRPPVSWPNDFRHLQRPGADSAIHVQALHSLAQTNSIEKRFR
jgi:hypothetical protein